MAGQQSYGLGVRIMEIFKIKEVRLYIINTGSSIELLFRISKVCGGKRLAHFLEVLLQVKDKRTIS